MMFMRNNTEMVLMASRGFATPTKKIGPNDQLKEAKKEAKKYGIKRRFYDHFPAIARQLPQGQYRAGLTENDLEGYNDQVKQALSLTNASVPEITQARIQEIIKMYV